MAVIQLSPFSKKVIETILKIPKGKVATYKQIAELAGKPQGARGVSWILHSCSTTYKLPWHRVLNSQGRISFEVESRNYREQKKKLEKEGVEFSADGKLDLLKFQWSKRPAKSKSQASKPKMFS
ncbi:DNA methyltransferase [Bdellovibrio sp. ZAP7]|uniref:MGMT family protein n=1 Tax=Bdellovibrio sp. ZAP7 TaxID=2231053 RepID=UPI00115AC85C|nr:MGMT family protein [Bdellovibrio sp. ZAP7]QDK47031.1 DNA methyltransferase [Bdellovibrio sp. ZAP7]